MEIKIIITAKIFDKENFDEDNLKSLIQYGFEERFGVKLEEVEIEADEEEENEEEVRNISFHVKDYENKA